QRWPEAQCVRGSARQLPRRRRERAAKKTLDGEESMQRVPSAKAQVRCCGGRWRLQGV
ncbi:hypothetical protein LTR04_004841, partial [Oleoguttula sp. CCFEE 6159]